MSISSQTDFFLDFQKFSDLKVQARGNSADAANAVAQQFEGLFVQQMLAAMRAASKIDSGQDSSYMDFYQEMYDKQLAQTVAGQQRLGFSKLLLRHMPGNEAGVVDNVETVMPAADLVLQKPSTKPAAVETEFQTAVDAAPIVATVESTPRSPIDAVAESAQESAVVVSPVIDDDFAEITRNERVNDRWQSAQDFITDILPQAQSAAQSLGVSAELLLAQSALETGWGRHTMKFADGRSSNNLFGIKAGAGWQGDSLTRSSLEHQDGVLQNQVSNFRAYATPAQSLSDYVDFIKSNLRYQRALQHAGDDQAYIREIHNAGYATDPLYADKVIGILNGETLQRTLADLDPGVTDHA